MDAGRLAVDHWRYVESVLQLHGEKVAVVDLCGAAYLAGFLRGWQGQPIFSRFGVDPGRAAVIEWARWRMGRDWSPVSVQILSICAAHYQAAFAHGWKHRAEVVA